MADKKELLVQEGLGGPFGVHSHLPAYRKATDEEVIQRAREIKGVVTGEVIWEHGHGFYIPINPDGGDPEGKAFLIIPLEGSQEIS